MKIQLASDLHFEFLFDKWNTTRIIYDEYDPTRLMDRVDKYGFDLNVYIDPQLDVDILVLAGDIWYMRHFDKMDKILQSGLQFAKHVIFIPGNHDFWKSRLCKINELKAKYLNNKHIHIMDANFIEIDGVKIFGGCMWANPRPANQMFTQYSVNDFKKIKLFRYNDMIKQWNYFSDELLTHILDKGVDLVISHFLPHENSIHQSYKGNDPLNDYFRTNMEKYMSGVKLWVHGHTHESCDYILPNETRVVCNPFGYYGYAVNRKFKRDLVLDI